MLEKILKKILIFGIACIILFAGMSSTGKNSYGCITGVFCESDEEVGRIADILTDNHISYNIENKIITFDYEHNKDILPLLQIDQ